MEDNNEFLADIDGKIADCMKEYKTKAETANHIWDRYQIPIGFTEMVWDDLEKSEPDRFRAYYADCEKNQNISERNALRTGEVVTTPAPSTSEIQQTKEGVPGGCKSSEKVAQKIVDIIKECLSKFKSKEEIVEHLSVQYQIKPSDTNEALGHLERLQPEYFKSYYGTVDSRRRLRDEPTSTGAASARPIIQGRLTDKKWKKQVQQRLRPSPVPRSMGTPIVQTDAAGSGSSSSQVPPLPPISQAGQPLYPPSEIWNELLSTLRQIKSNTDQLRQIKSNTDQMLGLMTAGRDLVPRPSKQQRLEKDQREPPQ